MHPLVVGGFRPVCGGAVESDYGPLWAGTAGYYDGEGRGVKVGETVGHAATTLSDVAPVERLS